jgi:hypothetical protein
MYCLVKQWALQDCVQIKAEWTPAKDTEKGMLAPGGSLTHPTNDLFCFVLLPFYFIMCESFLYFYAYICNEKSNVIAGKWPAIQSEKK